MIVTIVNNVMLGARVRGGLLWAEFHYAKCNYRSNSDYRVYYSRKHCRVTPVWALSRGSPKLPVAAHGYFQWKTYCYVVVGFRGLFEKVSKKYLENPVFG